MTYTFPKKERLNSKKIIQELFEKGSFFYLYPFKIVFIPNPYTNNPPHHQILVSVSKKKFKQAVDRNKVKRTIKEAYRQKKHLLDDLEPSTNPMCIGLIYTGKEIHDFKLIETRVQKLISKLVEMHLPLSDY